MAVVAVTFVSAGAFGKNYLGLELSGGGVVITFHHDHSVVFEVVRKYRVFRIGELQLMFFIEDRKLA